MKKLNLSNQGFALVETLIVAVFVMAIFSIIYTNFYPLMAEYEKREVYDDVDGKYGAYWIKKIIQSNDVNFSGSILNDISTKSYHQFDCNSDIVYDVTTKNLCNNLVNQLQIAKRDSSGKETADGKPCIYITTFRLTDFKAKAAAEIGNGIFSNNLADYVAYLPEYSKIVSLNRAKYRIIVEYHHTKDDNDYYSYSTIEVKK